MSEHLKNDIEEALHVYTIQSNDGDIKGAIVSNGAVHDTIVKYLNDYMAEGK